MVGVLPVLVRNEFQQPQFDFQDVLAPGARPVRLDTRKMWVSTGDGRLAESVIEDNVCRFPAHPRAAFPEVSRSAGDLTVMFPGSVYLQVLMIFSAFVLYRPIDLI